MLTIVQAPNPVLSSIAKKVTRVDKNISSLIIEMEKALSSAKDPEGVGLAAPQIGKSLQIFIIKESKNDPLLTCINPVLSIPKEQKLSDDVEKKVKTKKTKENKEVKLEGCLSLQDVWGIVKRYPEVDLTYMDENGVEQTKHFDGFLATIIQHEYDHLQGILFPRRVLEQKGQLYKSVKNKKGETEFEELVV
ncbi:MAG: peptide deformylase [Candidatus Levybacteria bacterium]|nr:peptide deformylase [Candidatus Levybacteria bacterium]